MVNRGPSQACLTCKTRRIRCDEGRPTCRNCTKSKRTCLGYQGMQDAQKYIDPKTQGRSAIFGRDAAPQQQPTPPPFPHDPETEKTIADAFVKFFADFVLVSMDPAISRGYFDGLEQLLAQSNTTSVLYRATRVVALANAARGPEPYELSRNDQFYYMDTLKLFQQSLNDLDERLNNEAVMTASLLGLYEMIAATDVSSTALTAHTAGVSALVFSKNHAPEDRPGKALFWWLNILPRNALELTDRLDGPIASMPASDAGRPSHTLDALMLQLRPTLLKAYDILRNPKTSKSEIRRMKKQLTLLNKEFSLWPVCQPEEWAPRTVGLIEQNVKDTGTPVEDKPFWPGRIDSYFDLYVAALWDTYRKCRLKLFQVTMDCAIRLDEKESTFEKIKADTKDLVDGMCASVPFQLGTDLSRLQHPDTLHLDVPGKPLGGLLLMYPLYIASSLSIVPADQRLWMKGRLRWIGDHMGIRQATLLGAVSQEYRPRYFYSVLD
jgi:hypothetical protein